MKFTKHRFFTALAIALVLGCAVFAGLRALGVIQPGADPDDPAVLARQAREALEAVKNRNPEDRRPASYDAVLAPLDKLLTQAKALLEREDYDPAADYEKLRAITLPIIDIAAGADAQARTETAFLSKEYRFNAQKGEASQYLANALWERILRGLPRREGMLDEAPEYPRHEMEAVRRILGVGLAAAPDNAERYSLRGVVSRAEGLFGPAARDLEEAVVIEADFAAAWNVLGLVRINLREFDRAEEALERARALEIEIADRTQTPPGEEYTATLYNLAAFHEGLAAFYHREYRMNPTVESQSLMQRHSAAARTYFGEFLQREPANSPDAEQARIKLDALP